MKKKKLRSAPLFSKKKSVIDTENGIIPGIVIIQEGFDKYGDYHDLAFLAELVSLAGKQTDGVKCRFDHPNMCGVSFGYYLGRYKNFRIQLASEAGMSDPAGQMSVVLADLHLDEVAKTSPHGDLYAHVVAMAEKNDDMFGNSIVFIPGDPVTKKVALNGKETDVTVSTIYELIASDLVDSPAATDSLFKSADDIGVRLTEILDENPEVFEMLSKEEGQQAFLHFLNKYKNYLEKKNMTKVKKSFMTRLQEALGGKAKSFDMTVTDETGAEMSVSVSDENDNGKVDAGETITADGQPVANKTLTDADGNTIKTDANGIVTDVTPKADPATDPANPPADPAMKSAQEKEIEELKKQLAESEKEKEEMLSFSQKQFEAIKKKSADLEGEIKTLKDQMAALQGKSAPDPSKKNFAQGKVHGSGNRVREAYPDDF